MLHALCLHGGHCEEIQMSNITGWCTIIPIFCEQGGSDFDLLLGEPLPIGIDPKDCVADFENCGIVHLDQTVNFLTLSGRTPSKFSLALFLRLFFECIFFLLLF